MRLSGSGELDIPFFLVQGTYQQLAEELRVGWHPRFRELLSANNSKIESEH